jgi:hypothetical protein
MNDVVANAIDKLLNSRSQHIILRQLSLRFYLGYYGCLTIGKALQQAMSTCNLKTASSQSYQRRNETTVKKRTCSTFFFVEANLFSLFLFLLSA